MQNAERNGQTAATCVNYSKYEKWQIAKEKKVTLVWVIINFYHRNYICLYFLSIANLWRTEVIFTKWKK